jgi:hypothetical protein
MSPIVFKESDCSSYICIYICMYVCIYVCIIYYYLMRIVIAIAIININQAKTPCCLGS